MLSVPKTWIWLLRWFYSRNVVGPATMCLPELQDIIYHCRKCGATHTERIGTLCAMEGELPETEPIHVRKCLCSSCINKVYSPEEVRISELIVAVRKTESDSEKTLEKIIATGIEELCASYNVRNGDMPVVELLLSDKNISNVYRQKKLVKKYLTANWKNYELRVKNYCAGRIKEEIENTRSTIEELHIELRQRLEEAEAARPWWKKFGKQKVTVLHLCNKRLGDVSVDTGPEVKIYEELSASNKDLSFYYKAPYIPHMVELAVWRAGYRKVVTAGILKALQEALSSQPS